MNSNKYYPILCVCVLCSGGHFATYRTDTTRRAKYTESKHVTNVGRSWFYLYRKMLCKRHAIWNPESIGSLSSYTISAVAYIFSMRCNFERKLILVKTRLETSRVSFFFSKNHAPSICEDRLRMSEQTLLKLVWALSSLQLYVCPKSVCWVKIGQWNQN